ncbi:hypothetical protein C3R44_21215, partial [Mycobacterium tuberculosis]|uniref:hypothetical protein n=1 Tax=Mycobacterium tuberculosis TaxID=1773 RepID=UPI000E36634E
PAGYGVAVVLPSLAGAALPRGVPLLAPGGRFLALGPPAVSAAARLGLAALAPRASFSVVALALPLPLPP